MNQRRRWTNEEEQVLIDQVRQNPGNLARAWLIKNLKEAKELLEKYKSITLEQLEEDYEGRFYYIGFDILNKITGFGETTSCILCKAVHGVCVNCIYSFRMDKRIAPCIDEIYKEMEMAKSAEELFNAIQKRISYLTHVIEWYETNR